MKKYINKLKCKYLLLLGGAIVLLGPISSPTWAAEGKVAYLKASYVTMVGPCEFPNYTYCTYTVLYSYGCKPATKGQCTPFSNTQSYPSECALNPWTGFMDCVGPS